jgi:hypothetical protein
VFERFHQTMQTGDADVPNLEYLGSHLPGDERCLGRHRRIRRTGRDHRNAPAAPGPWRIAAGDDDGRRRRFDRDVEVVAEFRDDGARQ